MKKGKMLYIYMVKLLLRILVFAVVLWAYLARPEYFDLIQTRRAAEMFQLSGGTPAQMEAYLSQLDITWVVVIWGILMLSMILHMIPSNQGLTMGSRKEFADFYQPVPDFDELEMYRYVQKNNIAAIWVLLVWLSFNAIFGALYVWDIIGVKELILLSVFYYVCDLICVVIWCPFQQFFIRNKCCVNCRIFNWGHLMMFTPLLFIRNFFTWSLFFTSIVVMLRWEITLLKHPQRFWEGSNEILRCANCQDKICRIKGRKFVDKI